MKKPVIYPWDTPIKLDTSEFEKNPAVFEDNDRTEVVGRCVKLNRDSNGFISGGCIELDPSLADANKKYLESCDLYISTYSVDEGKSYQLGCMHLWRQTKPEHTI